MNKPMVLIVDDEPDLCELLSMTLSRMGVASRSVGDLGAARAALRERTYDLCLTDMQLPDGNGLELVEWLAVQPAAPPVAVITAHGNVESAVRALKLGAFDFVSKPLDLADLRKLVAQALKKTAGGASAGPGPRLLGRSASIQQLRELIARVARSQAPVHIAGESGTGKELVAQLVHASGPRAEAPFIAVNCGAIPTELMESELFGHKRGSFTGAIADKIGMVQTAEGGTLFLDEVADLPLHMQVKLLRLIQEKTVRPVGEPREEAVDVRILSATHKDLAALVAAGRFREDLYYRINVIEIKVPPLRSRLEDVGELTESILVRLAARSGVQTVPKLEAEAARLLAGYHFPGNVRELENILERAMTLCSGGRIAAGDIALRPGAAAPLAAEATDGALDAQVEHLEHDAIVRALEQTRYNKTAAAKLLGISFRALRYRIKKLGIE
jgi:two-component system response regulator PilR (NtrC family)